MKVGELIEALQKWPQGAEVATYQVRDDWLADVRDIKDTGYWTAYNMAYVVVGNG